MAGMPQYPSFYLLGALAGLGVWLIGAPVPFPFLGMTALVSGALGLVLSLTYIASFERRRWHRMLATLRRASRKLSSVIDPPSMRASELRALRARS
jgi:hypothetical protein